MSLEDAIKELTDAIKEQTVLIKAGVAKAGNSASTSGKTAPTSVKAPKAAPAKSKPAASKEPTEEKLREKFGGYLTSVSDKPSKKRLTETVKPILEHFGVERVTEIAGSDRTEALGYADLLIAGFEEGGVDGAEEVRLPFMSENDDEEEEGGDGEDGVL